MTPDASLWSFIADAGLVVKLVLLLLLAASIASWSIILQRRQLFKQTKQHIKQFEQAFWSGVNLNEFSTQLDQQPSTTGLAAVFQAGFGEFKRLRQQCNVSVAAVMESTQRAMRVAYTRETERLEHHLGFLATVGSTSPYIGLFGTVWGIMTSFRALSTVQQATLSMVAPGISEALIATAVGLFAAIPAVIAYNRFSQQLDQLMGQFELFQEELASILHRNLLERAKE